MLKSSSRESVENDLLDKLRADFSADGFRAEEPGQPVLGYVPDIILTRGHLALVVEIKIGPQDWDFPSFRYADVHPFQRHLEDMGYFVILLIITNLRIRPTDAEFYGVHTIEVRPRMSPTDVSSSAEALVQNVLRIAGGATEKLQETVRSESPGTKCLQVLQAAAQYAPLISAAEQSKIALALSKHDDAELREELAYFIGRTKNLGLVNYLVDLAGDSHPGPREQALKSLREIAGAAFEQINYALLSDERVVSARKAEINQIFESLVSLLQRGASDLPR